MFSTKLRKFYIWMSVTARIDLFCGQYGHYFRDEKKPKAVFASGLFVVYIK